MAFREDSHFYFLLPLPILRRSLLEMGRRLRDVGLLEEPEDVFHLRLEELEAINDLTTLENAERLRAAVRTRSARREELAGVRLIDPSAVFPQRAAGDALITGTPASSGSATGPVRLIHGPARVRPARRGRCTGLPVHEPSLDHPVPARGRRGRRLRRARLACRYCRQGVRHPGGHGHGHRHRPTLTDGQLVTVNGSTGRVSAAG